ncbi:MAG: cache domain-containing protein [Candidatus Margulisbacteria bacterium]|nr:cache domain-containing protein [Candidatus Margulisiibacteriota bacterium]
MKKIFPALFLVLVLLSARSLAMSVAPHLPGVVDLQNQIAAELNAMDSDLARAAQQLGTVGLFDASAGILQKIYDDHSAIVDVATVDPEGHLMTIRPARYKSSEGERINEQPHFMEVKRTGQPVMSGMFKTVEGFYAVSLIYPVINLKGQTIGYVSLVFKPDALIGNITKPYIAGLPSVEALAIQKDGRVIYDRDILQIGKMTFSDPVYQNYPDLLELAKKIAAETGGAGTYSFPVGLSGAPVKKATEWTTISLHGVEWRLVVSKVVQ